MEADRTKKTPDPIGLRGRFEWFSGDRLVLAGLLVFTLLVRGGVLWVMRGNLKQDPDAYREIAENLLRHGEFALGKPSGTGTGGVVTPTAYRPPLYPVVLSNLPSRDGQQVSLAKVAALHLLLGVATVWLTYATARRCLSAGPTGLDKNEMGGSLIPASRPGLLTVGPPGLMACTARPTVAGLIVACDPILLSQQTLIMTETLAAFLAILALWCLARFDAARSWFNAALAGGTIGLAVLCRPTFLPWLGLVAVGMLIVRGGPNFRFQISDFRFDAVAWRLVNFGSLLIAAAAVMSPWAVRNYRLFGKPMITTTHGGYTLYLANNPDFYNYLRGRKFELPWIPGSGFAYDLPLIFGGPLPPEQRELLWDRFLYAEAQDAIRDEPLTFVFSCFYRVVQLWSPLPHKLTADESMGRRMLRYATCAWYCGVYVFAAIGVWRLIRTRGTPQRAFPTAPLCPPWIWGVLLCLAFTAIHTLYWTNLRMRAPLMPFVAMVAGAAMAKTKERRSEGETKR